jgi:hypothetical protein
VDGREFHSIQYDSIRDRSAELRAQVPKSGGPDFAIVVNFKTAGADVGIRIMNSWGGYGVRG